MKDLLHFSSATLKGRLRSSRCVHSQSRHRKKPKDQTKKTLGRDTREEETLPAGVRHIRPCARPLRLFLSTVAASSL